MYRDHIQQTGHEPDMITNPACGQLNREKYSSLSPFAPENLVSLDRFRRPVPLLEYDYVWPVLSAEYGSPGYGGQSCSWSAETGKMIFLRPRSRLRIWSRETGLAVPSRVSPFMLHTRAESDWLMLMLIVLTYGIPPALRDGVIVHLFI